MEAGGPENTPALQGPAKAPLTQLLLSYNNLLSQEKRIG